MSQTKEKKSKLYLALEKAYDESIRREPVSKDEQALANEREEVFEDELLELLEKKWGKSIVADRRTYIIEGVKDMVSVTQVYREMEGEDAFASRKSRFNFTLANKKTEVSDEERYEVNKLNQQLMVGYLKKTPRYAEIARQLDIKADRVRFIIEGPRRKK